MKHSPFVWTKFILDLALLYRQIVGTNCAPLVADLSLFCCEKYFILSLSRDKEADSIEAFSSTSRYLDDLLNIFKGYFDGMVNQIYPSKQTLINKANLSDTLFLD